MKKEEIRKIFFKLKSKGHSYSQCSKIIYTKHNYEVTSRTLQRWMNKLDTKDDWDLMDKSRRPRTIHRKITKEIEQKIIIIKKQTGWGAEKIEDFVELSHTAINKILNKHKLTEPPNRKKKRIKYIRWQRDHPNSLWQIDHTDEQERGYCYTLSILDDCSRYSLALIRLKNITTLDVIIALDKLIRSHGKPREILTDNGNVYGLTSEKSKFDVWCRRRGIKHIRSAIHSPTTTGKVERLFQTMDREIPYCNNDFELFRMRYNHFRPHSSLLGKSPAEIYFAFDKLF